jgi:hypothetical protein
MTDGYDQLISVLDRESKVRLLTAASFFSFTGDAAIAPSPLAMSDGPTGVKGQSQSGGELWRRWDTAACRWDRIDGAGEVQIARGLGDVRLRLPAPTTDFPRAGDEPVL